MIPCGSDECIDPNPADLYTDDNNNKADLGKHNCTIDGVSRCLLKSQGCPNCTEGTVPCGSNGSFDCIPEKYSSYYWGCEGKCISIKYPCNDVCYKKDYIDCNGRCLSSKYYTKCGGECIKKTNQCEGKCTEGLSPCGSKYCIYDDPNNNPNTEDYRSCGDKCINNRTPCLGDCRSGFVNCGGTCYN